MFLFAKRGGTLAVAAIGWMRMTGIADTDTLMGSNRSNAWLPDLGNSLSRSASSSGQRGSACDLPDGH
jgi:hypothetical protein